MASGPELWRSAVRAFPRTKKRHLVLDRVRVLSVKWSVHSSTPPAVMARFKVRGEVYKSRPPKTYSTFILFRNVEFGVGRKRGWFALDGVFDPGSRKPIVFRPIPSHSPLRVRCSCPDFRWRFSWENHREDSLWGVKAPAYLPVSDRGPANPSKLPGLCKHLMASWAVLVKLGVVR